MALLTSLALALTWTPTLSHYFLRKRKEGAATHENVPPRLMRVYERVLRTSLERPLLLVLASLVLVVGSYFCYNALGSDLLPAMDEGGFILDYLTPAGASLAETNRADRRSSSRFFARRPRSKARRGERDWSSASRRSPRPTRAISPSSSNATARRASDEVVVRGSRQRFSSSCRRSTWSSCSCSRT